MISPNSSGTPAPKNIAPTWRYCCLKSLSVRNGSPLPPCGRTHPLAQDVTCGRPSFDNSQMDGYALAARNRRTLRPTSLPSGRRNPRRPTPPTFPLLRRPDYPIMTGARPCPKGYDAVVPSNGPNASNTLTYRSSLPPQQKGPTRPGKPGQFVPPAAANVVTGLSSCTRC